MDQPLNKINKSDFSKKKIELLLKKYPERVPIVISSSSIKIKNKDSRFIVPNDMTIAQFIVILRKKISLGSTETIFIFIKSNDASNPSETTKEENYVSGKDILVSTTSSILSLYNEYKDENLVLNLYFEKENVFG